MVAQHSAGQVGSEGGVMSAANISSLAIAVRIYPQPQGVGREPWSRRSQRIPEAMLIFDTESRTDETQRLTFGSYRFVVAGQCLEEGLLYGDDLPAPERQVLESYVEKHSPETVGSGYQKLRLLSRKEFVQRFYRAAFKARCLVVAFNFPFDASRIACDFTDARERFSGGFSLGLFSYVDQAGRERPNPHRPRIAIKHIDSKRALKGFTGSHKPDLPDQIPEDSETAQPQEGYFFRGHFLDLVPSHLLSPTVGIRWNQHARRLGSSMGNSARPATARSQRNTLITTAVMCWPPWSWRKSSWRNMGSIP